MLQESHCGKLSDFGNNSVAKMYIIGNGGYYSDTILSKLVHKDGKASPVLENSKMRGEKSY